MIWSTAIVLQSIPGDRIEDKHYHRGYYAF
jgi:hypothetical protein